MARQFFHEKSAHHFLNELKNEFHHHRWMMALFAQIEKAGKASRRPHLLRTPVQLFPPWRDRIHLVC